MHCVVTAGPAYEPIDRVRRLTNFSTGKLGAELAGYLAAQGHTVTLLKSETSTYPDVPAGVQLIPFSTADDLRSKIETLCDTDSGESPGASPVPRRPVEALFHAAAVADFQCNQVWRRSATGEMQPVEGAKISSRDESLYLELVPAPKIIGWLRQAFPEAWLVGWKYEVEGDKESLLGKAENQIRENGTDGCVLNGPGYGAGFGWVQRDAPNRHLASQKDLFETLALSLTR